MTHLGTTITKHPDGWKVHNDYDEIMNDQNYGVKVNYRALLDPRVDSKLQISLILNPLAENSTRCTISGSSIPERRDEGPFCARHT